MQEEEEKFEELFTEWASVLIAAPDLGEIAGRSAHLLELTRRISLHLSSARYYAHLDSEKSYFDDRAGRLLLAALEEYPRAELELTKLVTRYTTGQPLRPLSRER